MNVVRFSVAALLLLAAARLGGAADLPKTVVSAPCQAAPTIDGVLGDSEWKDVPVVEFDMTMTSVKPPAAVKWTCQVRAMNSANALYVALRVPDTKANESLNPLDMDAAILAFCRGKELARGDDRKTIIPGLFADKHFLEPGKEADDRRQDGRGAMRHDQGAWTMEWAVPLDSGDPEDLKAKPGDAVKFNLCYFDGFRFDLEKTRVGVAYGPDLDHAAGWGEIKLAADVKHDGGAAFRGLAWVDTLFKSMTTAPANRLKLTAASPLAAQPRPAGKASVTYSYLDPAGKEQTGKAKVYLPDTVQLKGMKVPLFYSAGYELDDNGALAQVRRGWAVVTPAEVNPNPLVRTANADLALLHIARSLPFIDDSKVVIAGGSAGGYMTLMLAAETFPLAGAAPDVPPVNWGYNAAYFFKQKDLVAPAKPGAAPKVPILFVIVPVLEQAIAVYGERFDDVTWFRHSPVAHANTITCPVSVVWTTADVLVPIDQVGGQWVKPFDAAKFPEGFTMDPAKLTATREGRLRLMDVLAESDYEAVVLPVPKEEKPAARKPLALPVSNKRWSIAILDEGPPEPQVGHFKYQPPLTRDEFYKKVMAAPIAAGQLTAVKLERLMDRYAGKEWLPTKLKHLDFPESERADVLRGLRTYVAAGAANAKTFAELYVKLPADRRVLRAETVRHLSGVK